jgi:hypothetical protein
MSPPLSHFSRWLLALFIIVSVLIGCTGLESRLSLAPYTQNKQKRNELEQLAETYCQQKRNYSGAIETKQPDFIFTTDGCSSSPDADWASCCVVHDIVYWCGGSEADRTAADQFLQHCVNQRVEMIGDVYYLGVIMGGAPWWPTPWRWGYGWKDWPRGYEELQNSPPVIPLLEKLKAEEIIQQHLQNTSN